MKTIKLRVGKEEIFLDQMKQPVILKTVDLLTNVINQPKEGGLSVSEMMQRLRILSLIETQRKMFELPTEMLLKDIPEEYYKKTAQIKIEDEDYRVLSELVKNFRWGLIANFIVSFVNSFE